MKGFLEEFHKKVNVKVGQSSNPINTKLESLQMKKQITKEEAAEFYKVHQTKPFYDRLCEYLSSGIIVVMILEGENSIKVYRETMGSTDPKSAQKGTIREKYGISIDKNSVHGSDSPENATKEINFFFKS